MLVVFTKLMERLEIKRYFESEELTQEQQKLLESDSRVIVEDYGNNFKVYTLLCYLNCK